MRGGGEVEVPWDGGWKERARGGRDSQKGPETADRRGKKKKSTGAHPWRCASCYMHAPPWPHPFFDFYFYEPFRVLYVATRVLHEACLFFFGSRQSY